nr:MAG TPA: hypothetical protein [Bacteriophage sp.]
MLLFPLILQSSQMTLEERPKEFVRVSFLKMFSQILNLRKTKESEETEKLRSEEVIIQSELEDQSPVKERISLSLMIL